MIDEGETAPGFELPAYVDGEHRQVTLSEYLGDDVVILAFFPAVFNPGCDVESDLDQLDLFTMQPDVTVLAVGPDTLYANEAFADEYELHIPLLADTKREVADAYDVAYEDGRGQSLIARSVFVLDHDGEIVHAWSSKDPASLANVDAIKDALGETGGDDTAHSRYRVGHAHYVEARRAFTSAMDAFSTSDWMMAQSDFKRARDEFEEAEQQFTSGVRFVDTDLYAEHYDAAKEKASSLWQASDWLARAASEFSSGAGAAGEELRSDAERPLETARTWPEPHDPDEWPPEAPPERTDVREDRPAFLQDDEDEEPASLEVDLDEDEFDDADAGSDDGAVGSAESRPDTAADAATVEADGATATDGVEAGGVGPAEDDFDDDELAEIEAEIAASGPDEPPDDEPPAEGDGVFDDMPDEPPDTATAEDEPDVDAIEEDPGGGASSGSLEVEDGDQGGTDPLEPEATGDDADTGADDLDEIEPQSTHLDGIPSEAELEDDEDDE